MAKTLHFILAVASCPALISNGFASNYFKRSLASKRTLPSVIDTFQTCESTCQSDLVDMVAKDLAKMGDSIQEMAMGMTEAVSKKQGCSTKCQMNVASDAYYSTKGKPVVDEYSKCEGSCDSELTSCLTDANLNKKEKKEFVRAVSDCQSKQSPCLVSCKLQMAGNKLNAAYDKNKGTEV